MHTHTCLHSYKSPQSDTVQLLYPHSSSHMISLTNRAALIILLSNYEKLLLVSLIDGILKKKWSRFVDKSDHRGQTLNPMLLYTRYHKTYIQTHGTRNSVTLPLGDYWQACGISGYKLSIVRCAY